MMLWGCGKLKIPLPDHLTDALLKRVPQYPLERDFFIDNLLLQIHFVIEMIWWSGLAPWEFEFPFPGSITSTFQGRHRYLHDRAYACVTTHEIPYTHVHARSHILC